MKTTNVVDDNTVESNIRTVECPYCKTFLKPIHEYIISMKCWHCGKPFKIEQDSSKFVKIPCVINGKLTIYKGKL